MTLLDINFTRVEYFAITGSILFTLLIFELIRRKAIKEEYSLLWLFFSIVFIILSFSRDLIHELAYFFGVAYPPIAVILILILAIILILIQFSALVSQQSEKIKNLTQEIALLKNKQEKEEKRNQKK